MEHIGVAIGVNKRHWRNIEDVRPINGRMESARFGTKPKLQVMAVDAPHAERETEEKEQFYECLANHIGRTPQSKILVVAGDFNARAGRPRNLEEKSVLGFHGYEHVATSVSEEKEQLFENRRMFLDFCRAPELAAANALFQKEDVRKVTHRPPTTLSNECASRGWRVLAARLYIDQRSF